MALNKTALTLKQVAGIDVYSDKQKGQVKDMVEILDELYNRWGDFTEEQQLGLAEAIAGKQQSKVFQSLMTNYKDVLAVREQLVNQEHFGSAEAENAQYLDSISGKLNALKQTWISILDTFANSESIKSALDVLISVSEAIDSVVKALDDAGILMHATFGALGSGGNLLKNLAGFGETSYQIKQVGESFELVSTKAKSGTPMIKSIFNSFKEGETVSQKLSGGFKAVGTSITSSLIPSLKGMLVAGLKGVAISAVFTGIGWAIDKTINKYKNLDKELQIQANTSKSQLESLNKQKSGLESIAEEYDKLSQKSKKTAEEVERYNELKNQIAELAPELVIGLDDDNNPILNLNGSLETYIGNLDSAIERQKTLFANDSLAVGKNALDSLNSSLNWNLAHTYEQDDLALSKQNDAIVLQRQKLVNRLNKINNEYNFKSFEQELSDYAKQSEKYNKAIIEGHQKVQKEHAKITEETVKAQQGMNAKLMNTSAMKQASEETKKLGAQMISAFDLSEVDSNKLDQMIFNMSKNLSSGEFDSSLKKVAELRQELEKTYNFKEYEENIEQYIPSVAKFLGVTEDMARSMLKVPEIMKSSEDALDEFLRSVGKTKQSLNFDVEAQNLAQQFYEVENALSQLTNTANLVEIDGKIQLDPQVVLDMQNNESIPEQIRNLLGEFNKDGVVDLGEIKLLMDVMTAFKLGNTQESQDILTNVQKQLDEMLGEGVVDIKELKFDVNGKVENVNIDKKELEEKLSVFGDREEIKAVFRADVVGLDKVDLFAETIKNLPTDKEHTNKFIVDNAEALSKLNSYQEVIDWIAKNPEVINTYKIDVTGNEKLEKAKQDFESSGGEKTQKVNVETNAEDAKKTLEETNKQADELSQDINLSVNDGELQGSVESFNKLIEYSSKIKDGEYKLSFTSDTGESIAQINKLKDTVNDLSSAFSSLPSITVRIETAQASKNVTGLRENIEKFNSLSSGLKAITFKTETAQASKNVTGLRNNVSKYITSYCGKSFSTKFNTQTAQASKNVTGLKNNVSSYVKSYGNKTFTTTFKVVTQKSTVTTSTSSGKNKGEPASVSYVPEAYEVNQVNSSPLTEFANRVQSDTLAIQQMARTGEGASQAISSYSSSMASIASRALNKKDVISMVNLDVDAFKGLEDMLKRISNELDLLSKKADLAFGEEKITYLKRQIELLQEQQKIQNQLSKDYAIQQNELKYYLSQKGFTFNSQGDVTNQVEKLHSMEKYVKQLEDKVNAQGDKKNEALSKQYESARDELEKTKKVLEEYVNNNAHGVVGATKEWYELQKQINETRMEIIQASIEAKNFKFEIGAKKFEAEVQSIVNAVDLIDKQLEYAVGSNKDKLFAKKIELLKQEQKELHNLANQYREQAKVIAEFLNSKGFIIQASDGSIGNIEFLESFKDSGIYEEINEQVEKYLELTQNKIPNLQTEWWDVKQAIDETRISILEAKDEMSDIVLDINVSKINKVLDSLRFEISKLEREINKSFGSKKESLLTDKINKLKEEQNRLHELANAYRSQRKEISDFLNSKGFIIHPDGTIGNPEFVLNFKEDPAMMEYLLGLINKYDSLGETINGFSKEWWNVQDSIDDARESIEQARKELAKFLEEAKVDALVDRFNDLAHAIDLIDKKLQHATGKDKLDLLNQKLELIKEQQIEVQKQWEYFNNKKNSLQMELGQLGFTFDANGNISNYVQQLEKIANSSENFEEVKEKLEEYFDLQEDRLPDLESSWLDLENAYKDALKEQLNTTKDIEDKITKMYKKQVQDRIDAMNKETDAKIKALKKQQDAYNKYRDEVDYKNDYEDKLTEISDIQRQLDIAMKDTSLAGQKKVKELQKKLADAQKELDKLTQNKIDSDINDMFDKESDRLKEENDKAIEELEKEWSDSKIAEMVAEALRTGIFTGIDGSVQNLQDAMLQFAEETGELFGVMGTVIKSELITNLDIAKKTVAELGQIIKELDLEKFAVISGSSSFSKSISGRSMESYTRPSQNNYSSEIRFDSPLIYIEGNVDNSVISTLESYGEKLTKDIINKIAGAIR